MMAENNSNISIVSIPSSDDENLVKILDEMQTEKEPVQDCSQKEPSKTLKTLSPGKEPQKTSTPEKNSSATLFGSPLKVLDISGSTPLDGSIGWESTIVISSDSEMEQSSASTCSPRHDLMRKLNYLYAVRTGLHVTLTQFAMELTMVEDQINQLKEELREREL